MVYTLLIFSSFSLFVGLEISRDYVKHSSEPLDGDGLGIMLEPADPSEREQNLLNTCNFSAICARCATSRLFTSTIT